MEKIIEKIMIIKKNPGSKAIEIIYPSITIITKTENIKKNELILFFDI